MASEMINKVCEAENAAQAALEKARADAEDIVSQAKKRIDEADAKERAKAQTEASRLIGAAEKAAAEKISAAEKEAARKGEQLVESAKTGQNAVTQAVREIIMS